MEQTIAVKLGAEIVYVTGTVNGNPAVFELFQGTVWKTIVARSETAAYEIEITGWDELGRSTSYATTLRYGFAAVTNRKPGAYYNAEDLNRVGHSTQFIHDLLEEYGYFAPVSTRTNWTVADVPTASEMALYLANINALIQCYSVMPTTPELPQGMDKLWYYGANAIEQTLVDMHILITNMVAAWFYAGDLFSGEV